MKTVLFSILSFLFATTLLAQEPKAKEAPKKEEKKPAPKKDDKKPVDKTSVTQHEVTIGGKSIKYTATTGTLTIKKPDGKESAKVFYIAYTLDRGKKADQRSRPLTFSFNGGPGSSSVWMHLGVFGPRRIELDAMGVPPPPPYRLIDNEYAILDLTDLVFIDPVSTGFSRAAEKEDAKQFHGVQKDIESVGEFIRLYITKNDRWNSPKYIAGESYGTTRAAGLAGHLQNRYGMYLNGLLLVSSVLEFQTLRFDAGNDLPYPMFLPTYTATAFYHKQLAPKWQRDLKTTLKAAEEFALGDYLHALMKGDSLDEDKRKAVEAKYAELTGLELDLVNRAKLRIPMHQFGKRLMYDERKVIGRFDSRYSMADSSPATDRYTNDPSFSFILGSYTSNFKHYVRSELGYDEEMSYDIFGQRMGSWKYDAENRYLNVATTLAGAMQDNPHLRVYIASGYYDLATPYFATEYTINRLNIPKAQKANIDIRYYEAGHMMYNHLESLKKMKVDMTRFYQAESR